MARTTFRNVENEGSRLLIEAMNRDGLTQVETAARLRSSQSAISSWLNGRRKPEAEHRLALHREFGIPFQAWDEEISEAA